MIATSNNNQHRSAQGRGGAPHVAAVRPAHTRVGHEPHGRTHERPVGIALCGVAKCSTVSPVTPLGGIAILPSTGFQFARLRPLRGLSNRRVARRPPFGRSAVKFPLADLVLQDTSDLSPVVHVRSLSSSVASFEKQPSERRFSNVQNSIASGARSV